MVGRFGDEGSSASVDVLVIGSGPVGLTAALELRRRGVECRIIDKLDEPPQYADAVTGYLSRVFALSSGR